MDERLAIVGEEVKRLQRKVDDAEWEGDPRLAQLAQELDQKQRALTQQLIAEQRGRRQLQLRRN